MILEWCGWMGSEEGHSSTNTCQQKPSMLWRRWNYDLMKFWVKFRSSYRSIYQSKKVLWVGMTHFCHDILHVCREVARNMCPSLGSAYPSFTLGFNPVLHDSKNTCESMFCCMCASGSQLGSLHPGDTSLFGVLRSHHSIWCRLFLLEDSGGYCVWPLVTWKCW